MLTTLYVPLELILGDPAKAGPDLIAIARAAEAAGFDACNLTDHPIPTEFWRTHGGHDAFDPFAALTYIAAATERLKLLTHIVVLPYRNPFLTAKSVATVDVLSGGRAILGIGAGYLKGEFEALGVDFASRGKFMDEAILAMKAAWSGEMVRFEGTGYRAEGNMPLPLPLQRPHPPIWGGGNSPSAIRRAARLCDGWAPFFVPPGQAEKNATRPLVTLDDLRELSLVYREERDKAGRTGPFDICVSPPRRMKACDAANGQMMVEQAQEMAGMGVNWLMASFPATDLDTYIDQIGWFGSDVLPKVKGAIPA